jgi:hypothetical protein
MACAAVPRRRRRDYLIRGEVRTLAGLETQFLLYLADAA